MLFDDCSSASCCENLAASKLALGVEVVVGLAVKCSPTLVWESYHPSEQVKMLGAGLFGMGHRPMRTTASGRCLSKLE
jgi:hypothetical protein